MPSHLHAGRSYVGSGECLATFMLVVLTLGREMPSHLHAGRSYVGLGECLATFMLVVLTLVRENA